MILACTIKALWVSTVMKTCSGLDGTPPSRREIDFAIVFLTCIDPQESVYEPEKRSDRTANQIASLTGHMTVLANVKNLNCIYI